jgi:hypothetical protein
MAFASQNMKGNFFSAAKFRKTHLAEYVMFFLINYLKNVNVVLQLHTNLNIFCVGISLKTVKGSSFIQVHMVTAVLNRCSGWSGAPTKAIIGLLKKKH